MKANDKQVGGLHYKSSEDLGLPQHWDLPHKLGWSYCVGAATKYLWRLDKKGGPDKAIQDLEKAIHYLQKELEIRKEVQDKQAKQEADELDYKSRFHGAEFPFGQVTTLGDLIRQRTQGLEDAGDATSRYTNQG
jgi:hypothetical protein